MVQSVLPDGMRRMGGVYCSTLYYAQKDRPTNGATITCMAKRNTTKLSDQVRKAMDDSGVSRYKISQETGIDESALAKFYNGHRGITTSTLDRLGDYLGLRIVMDQKPKKDK
jgi:DNA-binding Xre family transcriptional regulator